MEVLQRTANRGSISTGGYEIDNSLKFENDNSEGLVNNYSGDGTPTKWTFSGWVKRTEIDVDTFIFAANYSNIRFISGNWIRVEMYTGSATYYYDTAGLFRDTSAWYHIVFQYDSTQGTAANRTKLWVNGVLNESFGQYDTHTNLPQNATIGFGQASSNFQVGYNFVGGVNWKGYCGYMAEFHYTDGVVNDADAFGEYDDDSGIWIPKAYTGSHGSKGIYLKFDDSSDLGANSASGGVGDFSLTNITAADQATDSPTNVFATLNQLQLDGTVINNSATITEGATKATAKEFDIYNTFASTIGLTSNKWYAEFEYEGSNVDNFVGILDIDAVVPYSSRLGKAGQWSLGLYQSTGTLFVTSDSGVTTIANWGATAADGDIMSVAVDMDNYFVYIAKNGTWQNSGNPTSGATGTGGVAFDSNKTVGIGCSAYGYTSDGIIFTNFGGYTAGTISSAETDENGYGTFEYAPPTGYYALCTKNLAEYG